MKVRLYISVLILGSLSLSCKNRPKHSSFSQVGLDTTVTESPAQIVMSTQSTIKVVRRVVKGTITVLGYATPNPERTINVAARFGGRIEKLYFNFNYQYVKKGTKIMDVYSPDLNAYQEDHLFLLKSTQEKVLLARSREKLRLLGMTENQLDHLEKTHFRSSVLSVITPVTGYLLFEEENKPSIGSKGVSAMPGDNMSGTARLNGQRPAMNSATQRIRQGAYIFEGQTLFSVNDLKEVWGVFSLSTDYAPFLKIGTVLAITSELYPDETLPGIINFIEPEIAAGQKYITVRTTFRNSTVFLKTNSLLTARLTLEGSAKIQVPVSSIYDLGTRKIVWIYTGKTNGLSKVFRAKEVSTGITADGFTEITKGLNGSAEIAKDAGLLMDSESFLPAE